MILFTGFVYSLHGRGFSHDHQNEWLECRWCSVASSIDAYGSAHCAIRVPERRCRVCPEYNEHSHARSTTRIDDSNMQHWLNKAVQTFLRLYVSNCWKHSSLDWWPWWRGDLAVFFLCSSYAPCLTLPILVRPGSTDPIRGISNCEWGNTPRAVLSAPETNQWWYDLVRVATFTVETWYCHRLFDPRVFFNHHFNWTPFVVHAMLYLPTAETELQAPTAINLDCYLHAERVYSSIFKLSTRVLRELIVRDEESSALDSTLRTIARLYKNMSSYVKQNLAAKANPPPYFRSLVE